MTCRDTGSLCAERLAGEVEQRKGPLARVRLDRAELEFAADTLKLLTDVDDPRVEVDVFPAEAEHLAAAQAVEDQQYERAIQWGRSWMLL